MMQASQIAFYILGAYEPILWALVCISALASVAVLYARGEASDAAGGFA